MEKIVLENVPTVQLLTKKEMKSLFGGNISSYRIYNCTCSGYNPTTFEYEEGDKEEVEDPKTVKGFKTDTLEHATNHVKNNECTQYSNVSCACVSTIAGISC